MTRNFDHEFEQIFEMEAEEFAYVIVKNGKKTLLRFTMDTSITTNFNEIDFSSSSDILIIKGTLDEEKQKIYC